MTPSNDIRPSGVGEALLALAERCEKATGTDVSLNLAIAIAVDAVDPRTTFNPRGGFGYVDRNQWAVSRVPSYSSSLDAAMTLVPDNARLLALTEAMRVEGCATIWFAKLAHADRKGGFPATQAATPALALTAAALPARIAARAQEQHP